MQPPTDVTPLKNARNGVAGAIRNLDPKVTAARRLEVICYYRSVNQKIKTVSFFLYSVERGYQRVLAVE